MQVEEEEKSKNKKKKPTHYTAYDIGDEMLFASKKKKED